MTSSPLSDDCPARFVCTCGHRLEVTTASDLDFLRYESVSNFFTADCPACETPRPTKTLDMGTIVCVSAGEFIGIPDTGEKPLYRDLRNATFEDVPNPIDIVGEPLAPRCGSCDAPLSDADKHADSNAPEVGWEYYTCPECGDRTHPENAEIADDAQPHV